MKVTKKGVLKLDANDTRVGNFVFSNEFEHIKVQDINTVFSVRISKRTAPGAWMMNVLGLGEKGHDALKTWATTLWSVLSPAPDNEYVQDILKAADSALNRHPEWYGIKKNAD